jgi:uncharacterized repeat protein (TIGR01451 family)
MRNPVRVHASRRSLLSILAALAFASALMIAAPGRSGAATPSSGTIGPTDGSVSWTGQTYVAGAIADPVAAGAGCPPAADPVNAVCDHFFLTVNVAPSYWNTHTGGARVTIDWSATGDTDDDFDMYIYQAGSLVDQSGSSGTTSEAVFLEEASGTYEVRVVPFLVTNVRADGVASFESADGGRPPNPSRSDGGLRFGPSTIADLQRTEGEPLNFIHPGPSGPGNSAHWESGPFGTTTQQSWIHRSVDNGDQFNVVSPVGLRPNPPPGGGDTDVVVDDQGAAYWTDLEALVNLDCSVSNDNGNSWRKTSACVPTPGVDRQWFALDNGTNHTIGAAGAADNTVFVAYREVVVGVRIFSTPGSAGPLDPVGGLVYTDSSAGTPLPVAPDATCGQPRFDPVDRYLYYPCNSGDHLRITRGHVDVGQRTGIVYTNVNAPASPGGGPVGDLFPALATDAAGNVYAIWIDESDHNVYYAASSNHGDTWGPAIQINGNDANSNEFVWAQAGADGRLAVAWLGSPSHTDSDEMPSWFNDRIAATQFPWYGYVSVISNAAGSPSFIQQKFSERPLYYGQICNAGIACSATGGDRTMADFFGFSLDPDTGATRIVYNDVTSQHHGAHLHEVRQLGGPTVLGTTLNQPVPTNPMSDPTGDAQVPHYAPGGAGPNMPQYDFTNVDVSRVGDDLRVEMTMNSLASLLPPPGETSGVWLTRFQALSVGEGGEEAYRIFYVGAESVGGAPPTFFAGSGDAASEDGVPGDGCVTRNPEECKITLYPAEVSATGSLSLPTNTITIQVPIQGGFGAGRPIKSDTIYNVSGFTFGRSQVPDSPTFSDFLYTEADSTRSFDFNLIPQVADLVVVKTDAPDPVHVGQTLVYTVKVTNDGPLAASGVTLTDTLPKNAGFGSASTTQGSCTVKPAKRLVTCTLGDVAAGATVTVTISVKPTSKGTITNTAQAAAASPPDPNLVNNKDSEATTVVP